MPKTCAVCKKVVDPGTGTYFKGLLVHRTCKGLVKAYWWKYKKSYWRR